MAFCPVCGTKNNDGAKFCFNCGGAMNTVQDQPVQQAVPKTPEGFTPIPEPPKKGFVPITPENPLPGYTPIQPVYAQPITQPVQKPVNKQKSNRFCTAGLVFSIIGLCTVGSTSLIGLILSVIGFFSSKKRNQPGTGKAIAGMIMSGIIVVGLVLTFAVGWKDLKDEFDAGTINNPIDFYYALDHANERNTEEYKTRAKAVTGYRWVNTIKGDSTYLEFGAGYTYRLSPSYENPNDSSASGKYKLYLGTDAMDQIERRYKDYLSKSDVNKIISQNTEYKRDNFIILVLENGNGEDTVNYYGFAYKTISGVNRMVIFDMKTRTKYDFVTLEYYKANHLDKQ